ncbi:hypothetical protein KPC83_06700 [Collinsella sp. zg1085]|uniref:hypothetical protein n=1 Tax=Collinsella sp. zg1085 TaxID=2844380 RepID=UPI001C0AAB2F|nr:hypothetical protein [Collinsella sp. zg1085]QWT17518.1 hypothetical protein KPC83_06700 [Collinsella sp. zg1085]
MTFFVQLVEEGGSTEESYRVAYKAQWIFHPTHDLAFCFAAPVFNAVKQITGKDVFYIGNDMSIIATEEKLRDVRAVEELTMVGYPVGLWDEVNNLPFFRHATLHHIQPMTSTALELGLLTWRASRGLRVRPSISSMKEAFKTNTAI